jgi:glutaminase
VAARAWLASLGAAISVFEFHGNLFFGNTEQAVRRILRRVEARYLILDLARVTSLDTVAASLLRELCERLLASGRTVRFTAAAEEVRERLGVDPSVFSPSTESALEDGEEVLLQALAGPGKSAPAETPLEEFELVADLDPQELRILSDFLVKETFPAGATMIKDGDLADSLYFMVGGSVDVCVAGDGDETDARAWHASTPETSSGNWRSSATVGVRPK